MLDRHRLPRFPLVLDNSGALVEPIFDFLRAEAVQRHLAPGTLLDAAYALSAWWDFTRQSEAPSYINVDAVVRWTGNELDLLRIGAKGSRSKRRLSRCLDVISRFHEYLLRGHVYSEGPQAWRAARYIDRLDPRLSDRQASSVSFSYSAKVKGGGRPTPSMDEVERVLEALSSPDDGYRAARNWLMARWMLNVGLRRAGVASLTIEALRLALVGEGLVDREEYFTRAGSTRRSRTEIRLAIDRLRASGRTFVAGEITEKGSKTRGIKIPFTLLFQTLDYVWSERALVSKESPIIHGALWLSLKTRRGLTTTAVGDIVKRAFNQAGVRGSGHRLRACFAEEVVFRIYELARARADILFDENQVLIDAAEELGHSDWRSLRSYLNHAARHYAARERALADGRSANQSGCEELSAPVGGVQLVEAFDAHEHIFSVVRDCDEHVPPLGVR